VPVGRTVWFMASYAFELNTLDCGGFRLEIARPPVLIAGGVATYRDESFETNPEARATRQDRWITKRTVS